MNYLANKNRMRNYKLAIDSVWPAEAIAYIFITLISGTAAQSITPPGDNVVEGRPFTLQCRINRGGDAGIVVFWQRWDGGILLQIYESNACDPTITLYATAPPGLSGSCNIVNGEEVYSLTIDSVTVNMEDFTWRCVRFFRTTNARKVKLSVKVIVTSVSLVGPSTTVVAGTPTTFTCTTSRSKPEACAKWFIQRQGTVAREITTGQIVCNQNLTTLQTTSTLQFTGTAQDDEAKLYCTAINSVTDTPVQSLDYPLSVQFGPDGVTLSPGTSPIQEDSTVTITCTSKESNPAAIISLYNNNIPIPSSEVTSVSPTTGPNNGYMVSGRYSVTPNRYQDGHVVKCEAYRPGRQDTPVISELTLDVQYGPMLSSCKDSYTVVENQSIELTCTAWAKPNAQFTWKKGGNSLDHTETGSEHRLTSTISFLRISRSDSGIYVITVENIFGTATRRINVTVQYARTVTVVALGGTEITEGSYLELECQAEGVPQSYTFYPWTHYVGDIKIPLNNKPSSRLLQINNVTFKDQGFYECSAENDIGGNRSRTEIKIRATPKFPAQETQAYSALNKNAKIRVGFVSFPSAIKTTWYKADNVSVSLIGRDSDNDDRYMKKTEDLKLDFTFYEKTVQVPGQVVELGISDVTRMDFQTYLLVVENSIGSSNFTVSLKVADQTGSSVNIGAAVGGGIAGLAAVIIIVIVSVLLFKKSRMKPEEAIRPPEVRTVAQFNNGPQEGGVYQDLTINPDYINTTEHQPYATLCQNGREVAEYEQCDDPVNATNQYEDMSFSTQKATPDYIEVYPETTEYENTHTDNSATYYNL